MASENEHRFDDTLATFSHPRYELIATGRVIDGREAVAEYYVTGRTAIPDQRNELIALHHTDAGVIIEFWLRGTHLGGESPSGRSFETRMLAMFDFDEDDLITCERVYHDRETISRQLRG